MDLMTLSAKFVADTSQLVAGVNKARETMDSGTGAAEKLEQTLGKLKTAFAAVVSIAGIKKVGDAIKGLADSTAAAGDRIDKNSQALGMSRKAYQQWDYILAQSGSSIDALGVSMKTLNSAILAPSDGTIEALNQLGLNLEQLQGMSQEDQFEAMVRAFQQMPEGATKSALAMQLFGKQGQALMPLLNSAPDSIDTLRADMAALGFEMSDSMVDSAVKYGDTIDNLKRLFEGLKNVVGYGLMDSLTGIADTMINFFSQKEVQDAVKRFAVNIHSLGNVVLSGVQDFFQWLTDNGETITSVFSSIAENFGSFATDIANFAIDTFKDFGTAIADFLANATPEQIAAVGLLGLTLGLLFAPVQTVAVAVALLAANWNKVKEAAHNAATALQEWADDKLDSAKQGLQNLADKVKPVEDKFEDTRVKIRDTALAITDFFTKGELPEDAPDWIRKPVEAVQGLWYGITGAISSVTSAMSSFFETGELPEDAPAWIKTPVEAISNVWNGITSAISTVTDAITNFFSGGELTVELPAWVETVLYAIRDAWGGISSAVDWVKNAIADFNENVRPNLPEWVQSVLNVIETAWNGISTAVQTVISWISTFFNSSYNTPGWLATIQTIVSWLQNVYTWATNALTAIQNFLGSAGSAGIDPNIGVGSYDKLTGGGAEGAAEYQRLLDAFNGSYASGLDYVAKNSQPAILHEGEAVLNKRDAEIWRKGGNKGASGAEIAAALMSALEGMSVVMDGTKVGKLTATTVSRELERNARAGRFATA